MCFTSISVFGEMGDSKTILAAKMKCPNVIATDCKILCQGEWRIMCCVLIMIPIRGAPTELVSS